MADLAAATFLEGATRLIRSLPKPAATALVTRLVRTFAPMLPRNRVGQENLRLAFPDMEQEQRDAILTRMWENFARAFVEFIHVDEVFDYDPANPEAGSIT
ncbi:MAG: lipid A biosynthesis lauroyl acyltransferase, partial [Alphaproteobacteria bacterium]